MSSQRSSRMMLRVVRTAAVLWFVAAPALFVYCAAFASPQADPSLWGLGCYVLGLLLWCASAYWTYHRIFKTLEARWPRARIVREVLNVVWFSILYGSQGGHSS